MEKINGVSCVEVIDFKDFCKENGLSSFSKESQAKYLAYTKELEVINRPYYAELYKAAVKRKEQLTKEKKEAVKVKEQLAKKK